jgi:hypothetical protein
VPSHVVFDLAIDGGHGDLIAKHRLIEGDWNVAPDIKAVAFKQRIRPHRDGDIDIALRAPVDAVIALSRSTKVWPR